jgi:hypothetical protein
VYGQVRTFSYPQKYRKFRIVSDFATAGEIYILSRFNEACLKEEELKIK